MNDIINGTYEGYIWWSDSIKPEVYFPAKEINLDLDDKKNPFIVEGELYDAAKGESISIRFADGKYFIKHIIVEGKFCENTKGESVSICHKDEKYFVKQSDANVKQQNDLDFITRRHYYAQRMPGVDTLHYLQLWTHVSNDSLLEGMETLVPSDIVFIGFNKR